MCEVDEGGRGVEGALLCEGEVFVPPTGQGVKKQFLGLGAT